MPVLVVENLTPKQQFDLRFKSDKDTKSKYMNNQKSLIIRRHFDNFEEVKEFVEEYKPAILTFRDFMYGTDHLKCDITTLEYFNDNFKYQELTNYPLFETYDFWKGLFEGYYAYSLSLDTIDHYFETIKKAKRGKLLLKNLVRNVQLSEDFIEKHYDDLDKKILFRQNYVTETTFMKHVKDIDIIDFIKYNNASKNTLLKLVNDKIIVIKLQKGKI
jgi:hypothetical protein